MTSLRTQTKNAQAHVLPVHHCSDDAATSAETPSGTKDRNASWNFGRKIGRWQRKTNQGEGPSSSTEEGAEMRSCDESYEGFPLVQSIMATEARRTAALTKEGAKQIRYPKSNRGWIRSLFVVEGRALDRILLPWTIVTLNAVGWAIAYDKLGFRNQEEDAFLSNPTAIRRNYIEGVLELVLTSTMAFLLVFRLNRSATRFWMARGSWGVIVVKCRSMVGSILLQGSHNPYHRDQAIRWIAAFAIAAMNLARDQNIDPKTVEGILDKDEVNRLNAADHSPLHAADEIRFHLSRLFGPVDTPEVAVSKDGNKSDWMNSYNAAHAITLSDFRAKQLIFLEEQLNVLIDEEGVLERIKGTPLPMVYVTHLRTWLMLFLLSLPYFWEAALGYAIIPVECLSAFALLGLEGAASEVEAPFRKDRTNHLDMNSYCLAILSNILQQSKEDARRRTSTKQLKTV